jgi:hypothetical protein
MEHHHHRRHHRPLRAHITRNIVVFFFIAALSLAAGKLVLIISSLWTPAARINGTTATEEMKKDIVNRYREKYGSEWKNKLIKDYGDQ